MPAERKSISFDIDTLAVLDRRGGMNLSGQIQTVIHAYTDACRAGFRDVRRALTRSEAQLILDTMNGSVMLMPGSLEHWITGGTVMLGDGPNAESRDVWSGIEHNVYDAIGLDHLDEKWEIDGQALLEKLAKFDRLANLALLDWCQVMWDNCHTDGFWEEELKKFRA
ncbi:MAG: hypothetical protein WC164_04805 [Patescibacteria group bacterium]|jgi:hypothetical protein